MQTIKPDTIDVDKVCVLDVKAIGKGEKYQNIHSICVVYI